MAWHAWLMIWPRHTSEFVSHPGFKQPAPGDGSRLEGKGWLIHRTVTLAFTEAKLFDARGKTCAHATGTFKYVKRLVTGSKTSNPNNRTQRDTSTQLQIEKCYK